MLLLSSVCAAHAYYWDPCQIEAVRVPAPSFLCSSGGPHLPLEPRMVVAACTHYSRAPVSSHLLFERMSRERSSYGGPAPDRASFPLHAPHHPPPPPPAEAPCLSCGPRFVPHTLSVATLQHIQAVSVQPTSRSPDDADEHLRLGSIAWQY